MSDIAQHYDRNFKLYAVKLVVEDEKKIAKAARYLDLAHQTLRRWVLKYKEDQGESFVGSSNRSPADQEKYEKDKQIKDLEEKWLFKKGYGRLRQKPGVIYGFNDKHRHEFRVAKVSQVLGVLKRDYYEWKKRLLSNHQ